MSKENKTVVDTEATIPETETVEAEIQEEPKKGLKRIFSKKEKAEKKPMNPVVKKILIGVGGAALTALGFIAGEEFEKRKGCTPMIEAPAEETETEINAAPVDATEIEQ